jgi:hypothetical protein
MPNKLAHFAIEAEDVERALSFYETVFGWQFSPWGPPGFYMIEGAGVHGALQKRREPLPAGRKGYECSFAVSDIDASSKVIEAAGGRLLGPKHAIPTICELRQFADTEGNEAIICQYAPERLKEMGLA